TSEGVEVSQPLLLEVIPMISKAYRATRVNEVDWDRLARGKEGVDIALGVDVGKHTLWPVCRWADGRFERPWRVKNPEEIPALLALTQRMGAGRKLVVAMESSGTYGKPWPMPKSTSCGSVTRRPTITRRFSTACPRNTMARTPRSLPSWRPWA